jgi:hypothetical protein
MQKEEKETVFIMSTIIICLTNWRQMIGAEIVFAFVYSSDKKEKLWLHTAGIIDNCWLLAWDLTVWFGSDW